MSGPTPFRIAVICTGNRFRSPLACALLARHGAGVPVSVSSYGTLDLGSSAALPEAVEIAATFGVDLSAHTAEHLELGNLAEADLVLGFEKFHLASAVVDGGASRDAVFTLPELVRLLEHAEPPAPAEPVAHARARVSAAGATRRRAGGLRRPPSIPDPLGESRAVQEEIAARISGLCARLAAQLFAVPGAS